MRILQICAAYKPAFIYGGPTMSVSSLSEQIAKGGLSATVYSTTANGETELPVEPGIPVDIDGVTVIYFKRITKDHSHFSPALLKKLWKNARAFDVIHIHAWWNLVSLFSCMIALMRKIPVLVSPRGTLSPYSFQNRNRGFKALIHRSFGKYMLNRCHVHATSRREVEAVGTLINPKSVSCLPNFVKLPTGGVKTYLPSTVFRLIFFSRVEKKKGLDILINALPFLAFSYRLTIAGDGDINYINELKALAKKNKVEESIQWTGFQGDNKFEVLCGHDLLILPSHDENFGNVIIESLSQGTAVLISSSVGLADYVTENSFGWECELSPASVSNMITLISKKRESLDYIRENAPGKILADFNEARLTKQYIDLYNFIKNG